MPAPQVATTKGTVRGQRADGLNIFKGIPFAASPTGGRRFKPAQPAASWDRVRDATEFGNAPWQKENPSESHAMSEDCLYLNVWAPADPGPHPVFFWIFGGGNVSGEAGVDLYDGSALASRGIVVVTTNYRLSTLGFMKVDHVLGPDYAGAENIGIRDIAAGLTWVNQEIAGFGGDPRRVTVAGESAGGKDTANLLALDEARGLFSAAIIESATGECVWDEQAAQERADKVLAHLGIGKGNAADLLAMDAKDIIEAESVLAQPGILSFAIRSVVDGNILKRSGLNAVREGRARDIRILIGTNLYEYDLFAKKDPVNQDPDVGRMSYIAEPELAEQINQRYRDTYPELTDAERRSKLMVAEEWWMPSVRLAEAQAAAGGHVWMYRFDLNPTHGSLGVRACHTLELPFVFGTLDCGFGRRAVGDTPGARELAEAMGDAWANFVEGVGPGGGRLPEWPEYDPQSRSVMVLDVDSKVVNDPAGAERRLWDGIP